MMVQFFVFFLCMTSLYAMESDHQLYFSLKNLAACIGSPQTRKYIGFKENGAWNDEVTLPEYSIRWHDLKNKKECINSVYTFVQQLADTVPKDLFNYIEFLTYGNIAKKLYAQSYALYKILCKNKNGVSTLLINHEDNVFFAGGNDIVCYDLNTYEYKYMLDHKDSYITSLAIGAKPHLLLSSSFDKTVKCWDTHTKQCLFSLANESEVYFVAWHPQKHAIISALGDQKIQLYNPTTQQYLKHNFNDDDQSISDIIFDTQTNTVISGNWNNFNIKFKTESDTHIASEHIKQIISLYKNPNSDFVYSGSHDASIKQWDMKTHTCTNTYKGHKQSVLSLTYDTQNDILISGSKDAHIKMWDPETAVCLATYTHKDGKSFSKSDSINVSALAHDTQTGTLISGSYDSSINIWKPTVHYKTAQSSITLKEYLLIEDYLKQKKP